MSARGIKRLLIALLLAAAGWFLLQMTWLEPSSLRLSSYTVAQSAPELRGLRIAVISDLHAGGPYIDIAKVDQVVAMTNAARPDLILLTGDYLRSTLVGGHLIPMRAIAAHLKGLHAPLGVYAVLGNHDRARGAERIGGALRESGIPDLENAHVRLPAPRQNITLVGIGDWASHGTDLDESFAQVQGPALCFTHSPDVFPHLTPTCAITIAGHTHGGQVVLPFLGRPAVREASRYGQRYAIGIVREEGKTLFVSSGIGTSWLSLRFGVPPEISLLTLR